MGGRGRGERIQKKGGRGRQTYRHTEEREKTKGGERDREREGGRESEIETKHARQHLTVTTRFPIESTLPSLPKLTTDTATDSPNARIQHKHM